MVLVLNNFIGGEFVGSHNDNNNDGKDSVIESTNPATGEVYAILPNSTPEDVEDAVAAATKAFPGWSNLGYETRAKYLLRIADLIDQQLERLALAESQDQGKPANLARNMDIPRAAYNFRKFAGAWQNLLETSNTMPEAGVVNISSRHPVGVAGLISPWNLPLYLLTFKLAPAIMSGNTVVAKPSEMTSVTAWMLCNIMREAELPEGVVNMVFGYGASVGQSIVTHPKVKMISFTGSTLVGQKIAQMTATSMKKVSLELGGKNAAVVFHDANVDAAVAGIARSSFLNQGEICLCTSRIFVHRAIYDQFMSKFVAHVKTLKVGDPLDDSTFCGAVNSEIHYNKVMSYIQLARDSGAHIHCGEGVTELSLPDHNKNGFFVQPTVISGLEDDHRCLQEEIFGPVTCVSVFDTEEEVIDRVNDTRYGLCASVWSQNVGTVHRLGQRLEVGTVWSNCWLVRNLDMPFGGCKDSGTGRESTRHSLELFTEEKTQCIKIM